MKMTDMTKEVIEIIDEAQALMVKMMVETEALADIAGEEESIKALALCTKAIKVTKDYALGQAEMTDRMYDRIKRIESVVAMTAEHQKYLDSSIEELNGKVDKLIKMLEEPKMNKEA